jgi:SAM-dependent methyltransferase
VSGCNLCGGVALRTLETADDGVRAVRCRNCGLIFLDPFPVFDSRTHYDGDYYRPWLVHQARQRAALWAGRADFLERFCPPGDLLDVGCGEGSFLLAARGRGWRVAGTEVSAWAAETLPAREGLTVFRGELTELKLCDRFDSITMWHVLEHTTHPLDLLQEAARLLREGGVLVLAVPNADCRLLRIVYRLAKGKALRYYTPGERELHLHHFTPATLRAAVTRAGLDVRYEGVDRGALRLSEHVLERAGMAIHALTGVNWASALLVVAGKAGRR